MLDLELTCGGIESFILPQLLTALLLSCFLSADCRRFTLKSFYHAHPFGVVDKLLGLRLIWNGVEQFVVQPRVTDHTHLLQQWHLPSGKLFVCVDRRQMVVLSTDGTTSFLSVKVVLDGETIATLSAPLRSFFAPFVLDLLCLLNEQNPGP